MLIEKSVQVFAEKGFHKTKVDEIVSAAGLAKGTVYQYFKSKDEILLACLGLLESELTALFARLPHQSYEWKDRSEFRKHLSLTLRELFAFYDSRRDLVRACLAAREVGGFEARLNSLFMVASKHFDPFFQNGKNRGLVKSSVPSQHLAFFSISLVLQTAHKWIAVENRVVSAEFVDGVSSFLCEGLKIES